MLPCHFSYNLCTSQAFSITLLLLAPQDGGAEEDDVFPTIEEFVGNTPLVRLQRLPGKTTNVILAKLEGNNPGGASKTGTPVTYNLQSSVTIVQD